MEVEEYLGKSRLYRRLRSGPHGQLVELYAARLIEEGRVRQGTWRCLNVVGGLLSWIRRRRIEMPDLDEQIVEQYLRHRGGRQSIQPGDWAALKRWLVMLRDEGLMVEVAKDLGIGRSSLSKWKSHFKEAELLAGPHDDVQKELARLRRENELLRAERDLLKKATAFFAKESSR